MSPEIKISGIPEDTEAIVLMFNDETFQPMDRGGHGKVAMLIEPGATELYFHPSEDISLTSRKVY